MFFRCLSFLTLAILSAEAAPNVVLIIADDLGYGDVGCYRETGVQGVYETPRIDELAASGLRLTDFYQADSASSASRAAMLTGSYPGRIGITGDFDPGEASAERGKGLNSQEVTIAEALKPKGYVSAFFGTWHLGIEPEFLPMAQGFDQFFGLPYPHGIGESSELPLIDGREVIAKGPDLRQLTQRYTDHAKRFIWAQAAAEVPFFLCVSHSMPRSPLFVSKKFSGAAEYGLYGDVVRELDWSVGQIVEALGKAGVEKNTLVIFSSDHGPDRTVEIGGKPDPFVGGAGTRSEGGQRVPCILSYPGKIEAGQVSGDLAAGIDFLPTFAAMAGVELEEDREIDGLNLWPWLSGEAEASPRDAFFYSPWVAREGDWKYYMPGKYEEVSGVELVERTYANSRVYFLPQDPREIRSLHESQSEFAVSMAAKCKAFQAELEAKKRPVGWE